MCYSIPPLQQSEDRKSPDSELMTFNLSQQSPSHRPPSFLPIFTAIQDQSIPFPRTSGAKFSGAGTTLTLLLSIC